MKNALLDSKNFRSPYSIKKIAELASRHVSIGNMAGEGWFLTGEMVKLIEEDVKNIICLQPFGCLPNHITGKGVMHNLRESYENGKFGSKSAQQNKIDVGGCEERVTFEK